MTTFLDRTDELRALHRELFGEQETNDRLRPERPSIGLGDQQVLDSMFSARNGAQVQALFNGDISQYNEDKSRGDSALVFHLAFWTGGDTSQIDRLFRQSALYREKLERQDYRDRTINKALNLVTAYHDPNRSRANGNGHARSSYEEPKPSTTADDDFWQARAELARLRNYSLARRASPWAVLGCVLARVVAATPPSIVLPPLIGDVASLNTFVALVGPSGSGKGAAESTATRFLDFGGIRPFDEHRPGSGQGLAHAYGRVQKEKGQPSRMVRHCHSALFSLQEVETLRGLFGQQGSTLMPELRSLAMGERLGHLFVDPEKRVEIEAHTYRASLIVGVQPERGAVLLDDRAGGTPQRFLWLPTTYSHPDERPDPPAGLNWDLPRIGEQGMFSLPICKVAELEIDAAHLARSRGEGDALDGHLLLTKEKVAAALGLLNGHLEITEEDWQLAGRVMDVSATTRSHVADTLATVRDREDQARVSRRVRTERAVDEDATARAFDAAERQIFKHVAKDVCGGCKRRCITHAVASKYRMGLSIDEVISDALARDYISLSSDGTTYSTGRKTP